MLKRVVIGVLGVLMVAGIVLAVVGLVRPSAVALARTYGDRHVGWVHESEERIRGHHGDPDGARAVLYGSSPHNRDCNCEDCDKASSNGHRSTSHDLGRGVRRNADEGCGPTREHQPARRGRAGDVHHLYPQAGVKEGLTYEGPVVDVNTEITIELNDGSELELGMGPIFYREEIGFKPEIGDRLTVTGFYEDGDFKVGEVVDESGETFLFRDEHGRPIWARRGNLKNQGA